MTCFISDLVKCSDGPHGLAQMWPEPGQSLHPLPPPTPSAPHRVIFKEGRGGGGGGGGEKEDRSPYVIKERRYINS